MTKKVDLVEVIEANPGCVIRIDNDEWWIYPKSYDNVDTEALEPLASSRDDNILERGDGGYGSGCSYGGDILQALAEIVGIRIESV